MPNSLNDQQLSAYERDGYLCPLSVFTEQEAERYAASYAELEQALGGSPKATQLSLTHLFFDWSYEIVTHPRVLDAVESVLGPDILVWSTSIFAKKPHNPSYISFHQDGTYWGLDSTQVTTAWIALTASTAENGCMRVVPGTHKERIFPHVETHAADNMLTRGQEVQVDVNESEVVDLVLGPGEMSLHHINIIHGSGPNRSNGRRIGFAIRYMTPAVNQMGDKTPVVLARGEDRHGHFELLKEPPRPASTQEALVQHQAVALQHLQALTTTKPGN